jgi:hypothetical protein
MGRLLSVHERLDFRQVLLGFTPAKGDVFARVPEIVPATVEGQRPQHNISVQTRNFSNSHLRTVKTSQDCIENIAGCEVVKILIEHGAPFVLPSTG